MGAEVDYRVYDLDDDNDKEKQWKFDVDESLYHRGHSYSGAIGMLGEGFTEVKFVAKDVEDAIEYIADEHDKWDGAMAVKTKEGQIVIGGWCSS